MKCLLTVLATLVLAPMATLAVAGECRPALRPLLLNTSPEPGSLRQVHALCQAEADEGDADALYQLALFHLGLGGEWQPDAAIPMIREAAAAGVPEAQYWLAWQHESGELLPRDEAIALGWYQRAANAEHRLALGRLAEAYAGGELGLQRDPAKAMEYQARQAKCARKEAAGS